MIGNIKNNQKGLTIIEMVVATSIFIIAITIAVTILIGFLNNPALVADRQKVEKNCQFIMTQITHDFRNYQLDYDYYVDLYGDIDNWADNAEIVLLDNNGEQIKYEYFNGDILYEKDGFTTQLNDDIVEFNELYFSIRPLDNPWESGSGIDIQPSITVVMDVSHANPDKNINYWLQTTVTSRNYIR